MKKLILICVVLGLLSASFGFAAGPAKDQPAAKGKVVAHHKAVKHHKVVRRHRVVRHHKVKKAAGRHGRKHAKKAAA